MAKVKKPACQEQVMVRLTYALENRLQEAADALGRSRAEVIRLLLMRELVWVDSGFAPIHSMFPPTKLSAGEVREDQKAHERGEREARRRT